MIESGKIVNELNDALDNLEVETSDVLLKSEKAIKLIKSSVEALRGLVIKYDFENEEEEIHFFKNTKPLVFSKLIYYAKLFTIESRRPRGSNRYQVKYLNEQVNKLQSYFSDNLEFYHYYRKNATIFDEHYFLRGKEDIRLFPDSFCFYTDKQFSTSHDTTVAKIMACDLLMIYLKKEIDNLENRGNHHSIEDIGRQSDITWTSQKVNLIELIYALQSTDVINNGTVDIKDIARVAERIFKIDLGDYYRAFLEIRLRKNGRTKFLDLLKENLEKRMEKIDD